MRYLALDIETLGLDPRCSVLEVAFIEEDTDHPEIPVQELPRYSALFRPSKIFAEPFALEMHLANGLLKECLATGKHEDKAWRDIVAYLEQYRLKCGRIEKIQLAGKNLAGFDLSFFPSSVTRFFSHRTIDVGSLCFDPSQSGLLSLDQILETAGIETSQNHRAVSDAENVIRAIRHWQKINLDHI